jgi:hypothetical protein
VKLIREFALTTQTSNSPAAFERVKGYREIPQLMAAIQAAAPPGQSKPVAVAKKLG